MRAFWLRWRARRRPLQVAIIGLAILTWVIVQALLAGAQNARRQWGPAAAVIVATHRLEAGAVVGTADVETRTLPAIAVPDGALVEAPIGRTLVAPIERGEVVGRDRVTDDGVLPAGTRGIAIPLDEAHLRLATGDRVDVIATFDPTAFVLAANVFVADVTENTATIAVPADDAPRVALALRQGAIVLVLSATPSRPG